MRVGWRQPRARAGGRELTGQCDIVRVTWSVQPAHLDRCARDGQIDHPQTVVSVGQVREVPGHRNGLDVARGVVPGELHRARGNGHIHDVHSKGLNGHQCEVAGNGQGTRLGGGR